MKPADILTTCDAFLLDRVFQPITDRLGDKPSAFDLGMSLELGALVFMLAADAALFFVGRLSLAAGVWDGFNLGCGVWIYTFLQKLRPLVKPGQANPLRLVYRAPRLLAVAFTLWSLFSGAPSGSGALGHAFDFASDLTFVAGMYLISCQPRPPGWRRAKQEAPSSPWAAVAPGGG